MRVILGCEESQAVCKEFRRLGHEAYSVDIQDCSGGHPEWHIKGDVLEVAYSQHWDLMIAFPPCTYLSFAGMHWIKKDPTRQAKVDQAKDFWIKLWNAPIKKKGFENPQGYPQHFFRKPDQIIQPYYFGDPHLKRTCLWLENLPRLNGLHEVAMNPKKYLPKPLKVLIRKTGPKAGGIKGVYFMDQVKGAGAERQKNRSKTFPGIARAMAEQWGGNL